MSGGRRRAPQAFVIALALVVQAIVIVGLADGPAGATALPSGFTEEVVASGFTLPTQTAFLPDGRLLVAEKSGLIKVVKAGSVLATPLVDLRHAVNDYWDRGLGAMVPDPDFATNGYLYVFYPQDPSGTDGAGEVTNRLIRLTVTGDTSSPASIVTILGSVNTSGCSSVTATCMPQEWYGHGADTLVFAPDGTLFVTLGDAASWDYVDARALRAQDLNQYPGKVLRINKDGTGLASNPFWDGDPNSIRSKVYAYGFRNPFRAAIRPGTSTLYLGDVGWNTTEEIDVVQPGGNYGWPCYEGDQQTGGYNQMAACSALYQQGSGAVTDPLVTWPHNGQGAAAVMGAFAPASGTFPSPYRDGFFYADYAAGWIRFAPVTSGDQLAGSTTGFATDAGGPVDLRFGPDGDLYYVDIYAGEVRRIRWSGADGGASTVYVSDLDPAEVPVNGWGPYEQDMSNGEQAAGDGGPLTIGGVSYLKGLGTHANSDLRFTVPSACTNFRAAIGIDDEMGSRGNAIWEVWSGTTTRLYRSPPLTGADGPLAIDVPVGGVTTLRLVTDVNGTTSDASWSDHTDWADARLSCTTGGDDTTAPALSAIAASPAATAATVSWTTDEQSSSQVDYGLTASYGSTTTLDPSLVTAHSQALTGLNAATTYHYRVRSTDAAGNTAVSTDHTFTTTASESSVYLSDLAPVGTPVNGWGPYERDMSNGEQAAGDGGPLAIGGITYAKGLGTHANSDLRFTVPAGCIGLRAAIGIDDSRGANGNAVWEVWSGTTTRLYRSPAITGADGAVALDLPLDGVTTLRLVTDVNGTTSDASWYDHTNWADAHLTCTSGGGGANTAPSPLITSPGAGTTFRVGDTITLNGSASDVEDGTIAPDGLLWTVSLQHCPGDVCHMHPYQSFTGPSANVVAPDHADDSHLLVELRATDSGGATATVSRQVEPATVSLTLDSVPSGRTLIYGDQTVTAPFTTEAVIGGTRTIAAPSPQGNFTFSSWSDGGTAQHNIVVPSVDTTLTATFSRSGRRRG